MSDPLRKREEEAARLVAQGSLEAALAEYQRLAQEHPGHLGARQRMAELLQRLGRRQEAVSTCEAAALAWAREGHPLRALALCQVLASLEPGHSRTPRALADLYSRPAVLAHPRGTPPLPLLPLLSQLSREAFLALAEALVLRTFPPSTAIVTEGEPGRSMFAVVEGRAEVRRNMGGNQQLAVGSLGAGEFFGEMALVSEGKRLASVVATEPTTLLEFPRERLDSLAQRHPPLAQAVHDYYQERLLANALRTNPLFTTLTPEHRQAVAQAFELKSVPTGHVFLQQGQRGEAFYLLLRGRVTPSLRMPDGRESALAHLQEGDVFGEISLLLGQPASATVRADTPSTVLRLGREEFEKHVLCHPGVRAALTRVGTERLLHISRTLADGVRAARTLHEGDMRV